MNPDPNDFVVEDDCNLPQQPIPDIAQKAAEECEKEICRAMSDAFGDPNNPSCDLAPIIHASNVAYAAGEVERVPVSVDDANELQDILHTLTNSGTALKTSARALVAKLAETSNSRAFNAAAASVAIDQRDEALVKLQEVREFFREIGEKFGVQILSLHDIGYLLGKYFGELDAATAKVAELEARLAEANAKLSAMTSPAVQGVLSRMAKPQEQAVKDALQNLVVLDRVKTQRDQALAQLGERDARFQKAEKALNALGYEEHGIGWAIQVVEGDCRADKMDNFSPIEYLIAGGMTPLSAKGFSERFNITHR